MNVAETIQLTVWKVGTLSTKHAQICLLTGCKTQTDKQKLYTVYSHIHIWCGCSMGSVSSIFCLLYYQYIPVTEVWLSGKYIPADLWKPQEIVWQYLPMFWRYCQNPQRLFWMTKYLICCMIKAGHMSSLNLYKKISICLYCLFHSFLMLFKTWFLRL